MVHAVVPSGKKAGMHVGRVAVRATGGFNIQTATSVVQGIHARHCRLIHRADGHAYHTSEGAALLPGPEGRGFRAEKIR
jgi:hypothetical protein